MSITTNSPFVNLSPASSYDLPLFLRVIAPPTIGETASYNLTLIQKPTTYGIHWSRQPNGGTGREQCAGDNCPFCADGHQPQDMFSGLAIDHGHRRFVIFQASRAASSAIIRAGIDYGELVREEHPDARLRQFDFSDPLQPSYRILAWREAGGPRYSARAAEHCLARHPTTDEPLGLADWFETAPGAAWLDQALANTSPVIRSVVLEPDVFDPMPLIWPSRPNWDAWDEDLDG